MTRSSERGIAMVVALFMVLVLSVIGSSLIFVSKTETMSSLNYKTMSQTRYGAESGVHSAANHLIWTYASPGTAGDPLANYDINSYPVRVVANGRPVVLSSDPALASNYPINAVRDAFVVASQGILGVNNGSIGYTAHATLLSMKVFTDSMTALPTTIQRWQVTGKGTVAGAGSAEVEVSAIIERQQVPLYKYAAFATAPGCEALDFAGGATVDSYDSSNALAAGVPVIAQHTGNVGTNGGLAGSGNPTTIYGSLSSPRSGVGDCSAGNVTAFDSNGGASVEGGMIQLPQSLTFPTPPPINPLPPTTTHSFGSGCPAGVLYCAATADGARFSPPTSTSTLQLGHVDVGNGEVLRLNAGIYEINSIEVKGDIVVESGPVIFRVAGTGMDTPIDLTAGAVMNGTYIASNLQFIYGGIGEVKLRGNAQFAAVIYAPNAETSFAGNGDFYGAVLTKKVKNTGGASIHYDRNLDKGGFTLGNPVMSAFTWKSF